VSTGAAVGNRGGPSHADLPDRWSPNLVRLGRRRAKPPLTRPVESQHAMFVGALELDVLLGDVRSLKQKRSVVRPVLAELRRRFEVSAAEAGHLDLHRRTLLGVSLVAADAGHVVEVLDRCERLVAGRPELELLSARRRMLGPDDD